MYSNIILLNILSKLHPISHQLHINDLKSQKFALSSFVSKGRWNTNTGINICMNVF